MVIFLDLLIVLGVVWLIAMRYEIRLALLGGGLALAMTAGKPLAVLDSFALAMVASMVAPICAAMGFAAALRVTGCDAHLVRLLMAPLKRCRWMALPGGIISAYLANLAAPSQASVAAMIGPILIPLLLASGYRPAAAGAALVLGASFGGDLLNPSAQDIQALAGALDIPPMELTARVVPASVTGLLAAVATFTLFAGRSSLDRQTSLSPSDTQKPEDRIHLLKAAIPLAPVVLLLLAHAGWKPLGWLLVVDEGNAKAGMAAAIPVVRALLIGFALAAVIGWREIQQVSRGFFEGMGSAYRDVISLTITAQCFGAGVAAAGLGDALLVRVGGSRWGMAMLSIALPWALALLSGSGSGPVLAYAQTCLAPLTDRAGLPILGSLTCLGAAFGRTMSPVSAVMLCGAGLVSEPPAELIRRLWPALLVGATAAFAVVLLRW